MKRLVRALALASAALPLLYPHVANAAVDGAQSLPVAQKDQITAAVDAYTPRMGQVAQEIWKDAELGFHESKSSALLVSELKAAGFTVTTGMSDMPTAFIGSFKQGKGPVIGILAEYDALPGVSQSQAPVREEIPGKPVGHACGHNLFGAGSVAAAIAVSKWMKANNIQGEVRIFGTPAEEGGGGKVFMVRDGLFKDVDVVLHWHPGSGNSASQAGSLAMNLVRFKFHGKAAHAAANPWLGRSALDGVESMDYMVNMMREHISPDSRIHYAITKGGEAPNIVPELAISDYNVRHPDDAENTRNYQWVLKAAEAAAMGTQTTVTYKLLMSFKNMLPNETLGHLMDENLREVGGSKLTPDEMRWSAKLQESLPENARPSLDEFQSVEPFSMVREGGGGSTDVADVSYVVPTVGLRTATFVPGSPGHSWQAVAAAGTSIGVKGTAVAAKTLALTAAQLFLSPKVITDAKAELDKRRGKNYTYSSLIGNMKPLIEYRDTSKN